MSVTTQTRGSTGSPRALVLSVSKDVCSWLCFVVAVAMAGCSSTPAIEPLKLDGNMLTVFNGTSREWTNVEIWINRYYRVTTKSIPAGGRFQAPLDVFVSGYARRFDFRRAQIKDVRLNAKWPDGQPFELKKEFEVGGLAGALAGMKGKKP